MGEQMRQEAPYPQALAALVGRLRYRRAAGWAVSLENRVRDPATTHAGRSAGLTLVVLRSGPDAYDPGRHLRVEHLFPVPPATFTEQAWMRWLFDQLGKVDDHERMEDFAIARDGGDGVDRPFAPTHGPGHDPYTVHEYVAEVERRTSYQGQVAP